MRSVFAIGVVLVASAGAACLTLWPRRPPSVGPGAALAAERPSPAGQVASSDERRLDMLEREVQRLRAEVRQRDARSAAEQPPVDAPDQDLALLVELEEAEFDLLDEIFEDERADPAWGGAHVDRMSSAFVSAQVSGSTLQSLDCRSTFCRAELSHASTEAQELAAALLPSADGWNTSGSIHFVEDEQGIRSVYYVAREGQRLPSLADET